MKLNDPAQLPATAPAQETVQAKGRMKRALLPVTRARRAAGAIIAASSRRDAYVAGRDIHHHTTVVLALLGPEFASLPAGLVVADMPEQIRRGIELLCSGLQPMEDSK